MLVLLLGGLGWWWSTTLVPSTYSVMDMGTMDPGTGPGPGTGSAASAGSAIGGRSVAELTGPSTGTPDLAVELVARKQRFTLASGERENGYTLNGSSPGPALQVRQGGLVQVTLRNVNVPAGVTLHWHGVDVPNAEDGVAGVTQDAVLPGRSFVYRFVARQAGTYWYHSHQVAHEQVRDGLFGTLVVLPEPAVAGRDVVAPVHTYAGRRTLGGRTGVTAVAAQAGDRVRVRLVNTDNGLLESWVSGGPFRVVAVDGRDLDGPTDLRGTGIPVAAGGRMDVLVTVPARIDVGGGAALAIGPPGHTPAVQPEPAREMDLLTYGRPAPLPFDPGRAAHHFEYRIGRRIGVVDGKPGFWWTINGHLFPHVPMFMVREGDVVRMTISNDSGAVHPMHLHGHHALVLSRNGVPSTGSPWWVDSLSVSDGQRYEIAFVADNPGVWMDHCHNLDHANDGLVAHLAYTGVTDPFVIGGHAANAPE